MLERARAARPTRSSRRSPRARGRFPPPSSRRPRSPYFARVETVADPVAARLRGRELAGPDGALLVAGSLYLLADLSGDE